MATAVDRFRRAQDDPDSGFAAAIAELRAGRKRGHWIWYVFPQLRGLGSSGQSEFYGVDGLDEATGYLEDAVLGPRLLEAATVVAGQNRKGIPFERLMGSSIDVLKLVSSLTLFEAAGSRLAQQKDLESARAIVAVADEVLTAAAVEGYRRCSRTLASLNM
jgi:uncharacterized protein (DUF1810 family)